MKIDMMRERDIGVSFLDLDKELNGMMFGRDLVHLNVAGSKRLGGRLVEWLRATRKLQEARSFRREERSQ